MCQFFEAQRHRIFATEALRAGAQAENTTVGNAAAVANRRNIPGLSRFILN
jgi:hypothetical protein